MGWLKVETESRTLTVRRHFWKLFGTLCRRSKKERLLSCAVQAEKVHGEECQNDKQYEAGADSGGAAPLTEEACHGFGDHSVGLRCRMFF